MSETLDGKVDRFVEGLTDGERAELDAAVRLEPEKAATGEWAEHAHWSLAAAAAGWVLSLFIVYDMDQTAALGWSKPWPWGLALALAASMQFFAAFFGAVTVAATARTAPRSALFGIYGLALAFGWLLTAVVVVKLGAAAL